MALIDNLVSFWSFEETSGGTAVDSHGSNNGTYNGNLPDAVAGKPGNGQDFDGTGDYVQISDSASIDIPNLSIQAWIKPHSNSLSGFIRLASETGVVEVIECGC